MDPNKLRHFIAVLDHGHFGRAAEASGVSQQAVSKSIARLEAQMEVKLFERNHHGAAPTQFGLALAERARLIIAEARLASAEVAALKGARRGQLRIGIGLGFADRIMPVTFARFREVYPGFGIEAFVGSSATLYPLLLKGDLDFVISAPPVGFGNDPELRRELLFVEEDTVVVRADHPLVSSTAITMADLIRYPWITSHQLSGMWSRICRVFVAHNLEPPTEVMRTDSTTLAKALLKHGNYISVLGMENISQEVASGALRCLNVQELPERREAFIAYRRRSPLQTGARKLIEITAKVCAEMRN